MMKYKISTGETIQIDPEDYKLVKQYKWSTIHNNGYLFVRTTTYPRINLMTLIGQRMGLKSPIKLASNNRLDYRRSNIIPQRKINPIKTSRVSSTGVKGIYKNGDYFVIKDTRTGEYIHSTKTLNEAIILQKNYKKQEKNTLGESISSSQRYH